MIEDLTSVLYEQEQGAVDAEVRALLDLTPEQHQRYQAAWGELRALHTEQETKRQAMRESARSGS